MEERPWQVIIENQSNFDSKGPRPLFSQCQKLSGQDSTPHVSFQTNNKSWRDDLVAKKESTSVGADRVSRSEQRQKGLLLLLSEIPGAFWQSLTNPKRAMFQRSARCNQLRRIYKLDGGH
jgi:hypothetical protein